MSFTAASKIGALFVCVTLAGCPGARRLDGDGGETGGLADGGRGETGEPPDEHDGEGGDDSPEIICVPDRTRCAAADTIETCAATGLVWEPSSCGTNQSCVACNPELDPECTGARCVGPCNTLAEQPA